MLVGLPRNQYLSGQLIPQFCAIVCIDELAKQKLYHTTLMPKRTAFPSFLLCWCILSASIYAGCNEQESEQKPIAEASPSRTIPFATPSELASRTIDTRRVDVNRDGYEDAIVTVFPKDSLGARIGFETLRIYTYDTTKRQFQQAFQGTYYYGTMVDVRDLNHDGTPEICIRTNGGGNSAIASLGMAIISKKAGKYVPLATFDVGNPELITLAGDSTAALLSNDEYYPEYLPLSEAVIVPDSLIVFAESAERAMTLRVQFYTDAITKARQRYDQAKTIVGSNRSPQALFAAYSEAVVLMRLLSKIPDATPLQEFITKERPFWRAMLPKRLHDALDDVFRSHP
jgi:hypothetical protein